MKQHFKANKQNQTVVSQSGLIWCKAKGKPIAVTIAAALNEYFPQPIKIKHIKTQ